MRLVGYVWVWVSGWERVGCVSGWACVGVCKWDECAQVVEECVSGCVSGGMCASGWGSVRVCASVVDVSVCARVVGRAHLLLRQT